jgi:NAD-dependent dihydropyrimidine dehydrogenase PreA subunit
MNLITVDQDKCIKCGICANECPGQILRIGENGPEDICSENVLPVDIV